jgi:flagellar FliJ protein
MRRFRFRLETLLRVREQKEKMKQREFAEEVRKVTEVKNEISDIETAADAALDELGKKAKIEFDPREVVDYYRYIFNMQRYSASRNRVLDEMMVEYEKKREELVAASREKRVMENLKDRHFKTWKREATREDQRIMDEIAGTNAARAIIEKREREGL